jgi:hypothetical protein
MEQSGGGHGFYWYIRKIGRIPMSLLMMFAVLLLIGLIGYNSERMFD